MQSCWYLLGVSALKPAPRLDGHAQLSKTGAAAHERDTGWMGPTLQPVLKIDPDLSGWSLGVSSAERSQMGKIACP